MEPAEKTTVKKLEDLDVDGVVELLEKWQMQEFIDFVRERQTDGRKLLEVTEGVVKLWRPKANAKRFILFIEEVKLNPGKHIENSIEGEVKFRLEEVNSIEHQYQTVNTKKLREHNLAASTISGVEELLKKIVPAKSFLYRTEMTKNEKPITSYTPMNGGSQKRAKSLFRLSSYEYPHFDLKQFRFTRNENFNDRGYYSIKTNDKENVKKTKRVDTKTKYKSLSTVEDLDQLPEDHFYEDLCYTNVDNNDNNLKGTGDNQVTPIKPYKTKIHELFQSFKLPFFKKTEDVVEVNEKVEETIIEDKKDLDIKLEQQEHDGHIYENSDGIADNMYDVVRVDKEVTKVDETDKLNTMLPVEDYLEPMQVSRDYCDVSTRQKDDSILSYIINLFESRFGIRRETNDANQSEDSEENKDASSHEDKMAEDKKAKRTNMADRPLPVPVENEPYYMKIDRSEAENLLKGHPDGTFVLRPSSQPNHAYTLTVSCTNSVHNVGIRRRSDGRLALGFARRGERSFSSVTSLLRHHRRRRLLLVAGGSVCGATTLNESPQYYQTPSNIPIAMSQ